MAKLNISDLRAGRTGSGAGGTSNVTGLWARVFLPSAFWPAVDSDQSHSSQGYKPRLDKAGFVKRLGGLNK